MQYGAGNESHWLRRSHCRAPAAKLRRHAARSQRSLPARVKRVLRVVLANSATPNSSSSSLMARDSGDVSMWRRSAARAKCSSLPPPESSAGVEFPCSHSSSLRPHHLRLASRYLASKLLQHVSAIKQESRIMLLPGRPIAWLSRPACGSAKPALTAPRPQPRPPPWRPLVPPRTDVGCDRADAPRLRHPRPDAPVLRAAYANRDMRSLRPAKHSTKCARTPHGQLGCAPLGLDAGTDRATIEDRQRHPGPK